MHAVPRDPKTPAHLQPVRQDTGVPLPALLDGVLAAVKAVARTIHTTEAAAANLHSINVLSSATKSAPKRCTGLKRWLSGLFDAAARPAVDSMSTCTAWNVTHPSDHQCSRDQHRPTAQSPSNLQRPNHLPVKHQISGPQTPTGGLTPITSPGCCCAPRRHCTRRLQPLLKYLPTLTLAGIRWATRAAGPRLPSSRSRRRRHGGRS